MRVGGFRVVDVTDPAGLAHLFARLYPALDQLATRGVSYEIIFVNDGSRDNTALILADQFRARPDVTRVVLFNGNYGQHMAILAGFEATRGDIVVTLDADLQNPPEEIGALVDKMREGYDYDGSIRRKRQDSAWRTYASKAMNRLREKITRIKIQKLMLMAEIDKALAMANCHQQEVSELIYLLAFKL